MRLKLVELQVEDNQNQKIGVEKQGKNKEDFNIILYY